MNVKLIAAFKTECAGGVSAAHTSSDYWRGALRDQRIAERFGDEDYETLARMSVEAFDAEHRPAKNRHERRAEASKARRAPAPLPPRRRKTTPAEDAAAISALQARIDRALGPDQTEKIGKLPRASIEALAASSESSPARSLARELLQRQAIASPHPQKTMTPEMKAMLERAKGSCI